MTEVRRQKTEVRRQRTDDRKQMTEARRQDTENSGQNKMEIFRLSVFCPLISVLCFLTSDL